MWWFLIFRYLKLWWHLIFIDFKIVMRFDLQRFWNYDDIWFDFQQIKIDFWLDFNQIWFQFIRSKISRNYINLIFRAYILKVVDPGVCTPQIIFIFRNFFWLRMQKLSTLHKEKRRTKVKTLFKTLVLQRGHKFY